LYTVELVGTVPVSIVNPLAVTVPLYIARLALLVLLGLKITFGTAPKAELKLIDAIVPAAEQPEPVVSVTVPAVSVPLTDTVPFVQEAGAEYR
jgi:hypothetical protein